MSNVIELSKFAAQREISRTETARPENTQLGEVWAVRETKNLFTPGLSLAASKIYQDPSPELERFFHITNDIIQRLNHCDLLLAAGETFAADDEILGIKALFVELYMLRAISEAVGMISLKCLQLLTILIAITDIPEIASKLQFIIRRLRHAPFMSFLEASRLVDEIEASSGKLYLPGYGAFTSELLEQTNSKTSVAEPIEYPPNNSGLPE